MISTVKIGEIISGEYFNHQDQVTVDFGGFAQFNMNDGTDEYNNLSNHEDNDHGLNMYGLCGPKHHYITDYNSGEITEIDQHTIIRPYLYFKTKADGTYEFELYSDDEFWVGEHVLQLHVELENYPTATPSVVSFNAFMDPCAVTSYEPPADIDLEYKIGTETMYYEFNYAQAPCLY